MALIDGIQNSTYRGQTITAQDKDGTAIDLSGATITGFKRNVETEVTVAIDGTLALVDAPNGQFSWNYGTVDVGTAGSFVVQFIFTYAGPLLDRSFSEAWYVHEALS